jgi:hypothetical protein
MFSCRASLRDRASSLPSGGIEGGASSVAGPVRQWQLAEPESLNV